ncbi:hypothetical protein HK096_003296 [Nowakowskiella sp. JEL0078]|nr:hypothetical protein HK096_003296 [Nowakowskiella sp. JEL0078]
MLSGLYLEEVIDEVKYADVVVELLLVLIEVKLVPSVDGQSQNTPATSLYEVSSQTVPVPHGYPELSLPVTLGKVNGIQANAVDFL